MGKRIIPQRRGRGSPTYTSPSYRFIGKIGFTDYAEKAINGEVIDIINCPGHSAPLMIVEYENGNASLLPAPLGIRKGQMVQAGVGSEISVGNILKLGKIVAGTEICNIEKTPFDKGQLVRASGAFASVMGNEKEGVIVKLASGKVAKFNANCRAMIGRVAGGGRKEKPFLKAGKKYHAARAKNKLFPRTSGVAMNAVDHPHGKTHRRHLGRPKTVSRNAPPGRKVGLIAAKGTGRKKR